MANELAEAVPEAVKQERFERFMAVQAKISADRLAQKVGQVYEVVVDEVDEEGAIARTYGDAPEIDGMLYLNGETELAPGDRTQVRVTHADEHDLWGELTHDQPTRPR